jgi:S-adenosyl-L-methionine hydrolase (adenosine-forming)
MTPLITLTTDFGWRDPYAAAMKGVIHRIAPAARVEDLSHDIAPQDVFGAAFFAAGAMPFFPPGTIHVIVVDPGVGTPRLPMAADAGGMYFICPDNGVLSLFAREQRPCEVRAIENPAAMRDEISATFHGRDIFAPAAAHLAAGMAFTDLGPVIPDPVSLPVPEVHRAASGQLTGAVIHIDHFGNAITNIHRRDLAEEKTAAVRAGGTLFKRIHSAYGEVARGEVLALFGSSGYLEIAMRDGNAATALKLRKEDPVEVHCEKT